MNSPLKAYLLHLRDILRLFSHQRFSFCIMQLWRWTISFRLNLDKANEIYSKRKHDSIIEYLNARYDHLVPETLAHIDTSAPIDDLPIWVFWKQGEEGMPGIVKMCYNSIKRFAGNRKVILLTEKNLDDYVQLPPHINKLIEEGCITSTHQSDLVRVSLLYDYGGTWMDATCFCTGENPISYNPYFGTIKIHPLSKGAISDYRWTSFNMFSYPKSPAMKCFRDVMFDFLGGHRGMIDYFLIDYTFEMLYRKNKEFKAVIDGNRYSNQQMFSLFSRLNNLYNEAWDKEFEGTTLFKLNWRFMPQEGHTIYNYLKNKNK